MTTMEMDQTKREKEVVSIVVNWDISSVNVGS